MNVNESFSFILQGILYNLPNLVVCAAGVAVVLSRSNQLRPALPWALLGFGLSLFVGVVSPFAWQVVSRLLGGPFSHALLSVFWSFVRAASYGCLLVAILVGREKTPPLQPPVDPLGKSSI